MSLGIYYLFKTMRSYTKSNMHLYIGYLIVIPYIRATYVHFDYIMLQHAVADVINIRNFCQQYIWRGY